MQIEKLGEVNNQKPIVIDVKNSSKSLTFENGIFRLDSFMYYADQIYSKQFASFCWCVLVLHLLCAIDVFFVFVFETLIKVFVLAMIIIYSIKQQLNFSAQSLLFLENEPAKSRWDRIYSDRMPNA